MTWSKAFDGWEFNALRRNAILASAARLSVWRSLEIVLLLLCDIINTSAGDWW
jgi:hypothetical protein